MYKLNMYYYFSVTRNQFSIIFNCKDSPWPMPFAWIQGEVFSLAGHQM